MTETTPDHIADRQYVVIVGVHDPERDHEQATDAFGPMGYDEALLFCVDVQKTWQAHADEYDSEGGAFPYGDVYFDVRLLRSGVTGEKAARNWIYDPDTHGPDPLNPQL